MNYKRDIFIEKNIQTKARFGESGRGIRGGLPPPTRRALYARGEVDTNRSH